MACLQISRASCVWSLEESKTRPSNHQLNYFVDCRHSEVECLQTNCQTSLEDISLSAAQCNC
jgi:hypothetical protein